MFKFGTTIVANDCVGGYIYRNLETEFLSPFIWVVVLIDGMVNLSNNWETIDFSNIEIFPASGNFEKRTTMNMIVDEQCFIKLIHHEFVPGNKSNKSKIVPPSVFWDERICDYIKQKWFNRVSAMKMMRKKPLFVYNVNFDLCELDLQNDKTTDCLNGNGNFEVSDLLMISQQSNKNYNNVFICKHGESKKLRNVPNNVRIFEISEKLSNERPIFSYKIADEMCHNELFLKILRGFW